MENVGEQVDVEKVMPEFNWRAYLALHPKAEEIFKSPVLPGSTASCSQHGTAIKGFDPTDYNSPGADHYICLHKGDEVELISEEGPWAYGCVKDKGWFPRQFVKLDSAAFSPSQVSSAARGSATSEVCFAFVSLGFHRFSVGFRLFSNSFHLFSRLCNLGFAIWAMLSRLCNLGYAI
jgi:hypothetical protein